MSHRCVQIQRMCNFLHRLLFRNSMHHGLLAKVGMRVESQGKDLGLRVLAVRVLEWVPGDVRSESCIRTMCS